jgi:gas vesicle protein
MSTKDNNSSGTVFVAFAIGALAGAAIALLYAPATGEETRRRLAEKARAGKDRAEEMAREGREFVDRHRETINEVIERGREVVARAKESL